MDTIGRVELLKLSREAAPPCVSIYMTMHPTGEETQQDSVRLKSILQRAEVALTDTWMPAPDARKLLQPARDLPADAVFWGQQESGLAVLVAPNSFHRYRLPREFDELLRVNRRYHLRPLLPFLEGDHRFLILTLSQNDVRLFDASCTAIQQVDVVGLPTNMKDALNYADADRGSQVHSAMHGRLGKQAAVFHGHGGQGDTHKTDVTQFFRMIDSKLQPLLNDERTPLLLAGVEYLLPLFREVSDYPHVVEQALVGNHDHLSAQQLHQKAWPLMEPVFRQAREHAAVRFQDRSGTGKASDDLRQIIQAAHEGRIDTLFLHEQGSRWGTFETATGVLELHEHWQSGDDDLLDVAADLTLSKGGTIYCMKGDQMPSREPAAALFRY